MNDKPTLKETLLLFVAYWIRQGGTRNLHDLFDEADGTTVTVRISQWHVQVKASVWGTQNFGVHGLGSTLARKWREIRNEDLLRKIGVVLEKNRGDEGRMVWDMRVDVDEFTHGVRIYSPWSDYDWRPDK